MFTQALDEHRTLLWLAGACTVLLLSPGAAPAQDIAPVISPGQAAEGALYRSRMGAQAKATRQRQARAQAASPSVVRERQRQSCASLPQFRRQYGAQHPKVLKLQELCARHGF